ncbi:mechanosensitive ion channel family protein [Shumkonia mesophila]|uniref:mechanosensitive ion channel family protein n=1 Tax=Shumkonia mesophila TaxID=2838854 RepID=UPI0029344D29|nr:mechanosensitive ion channel family protein [Shumkonia mesophila]
MEKEIQTVTRLADDIMAFVVAYGFQILGALAFLAVGLLAAGWVGGQVSRLAQARKIDLTLARFLGSAVKILLVVMLVIITLGNFGITIAPLIALAGASAFGATMALQGPLSNYGAGLSIILSRPFVVGNTITVQGTFGVVEEVKLAATILIGEDGERITIPNKDIVGQVIVNSDVSRVLESRLFVKAEDAETAIGILRGVLGGFADVRQDPAPQVGVQDFAYGGVVVGLRAWIPSRKYFQVRYAVNGAALAALKTAEISLSPAGPLALTAPSLSSDMEARPS